MDYFNEMVCCRNTNNYLHRILTSNGKNTIISYLDNRGIKKIIIYGSGMAGKILFDNLKDYDNVEIIGFVDLKHNTEFGIDNFIEIEDVLNIENDLIIITPLEVGERIRTDLYKRNIKNVITLSEIMDSEGIVSIYEDGIFV